MGYREEGEEGEEGEEAHFPIEERVTEEKSDRTTTRIVRARTVNVNACKKRVF